MDATKRTGGGRGQPRGPTLGKTLSSRAGMDRPAAIPSAEQVYHDYAPRVYHMARRMVSNDVDAEDVTQDVLLQVVRKLPTFRGESAFPTWLHRITVNAALSHRRKRAVREEHRSRDPLDVVLEEVPAGAQQRTPEPEAEALSRETRRLIEWAIAQLPAPYRSVFVLADVEGLPNAEVGEQLGLSLPAVKSRLHRARHLMRQALSAHFEEKAQR
jgi:RNA polymerase sigma-70 factor (ECF subfamily)